MQHRPNYRGASIVNLMASIGQACGAQGPWLYPSLRALPPAELEGYRNIVLWVVDGLGYDYLAERAHDSAMASYLRGWITSVFPATTASAVTSFFTGLAPQQHGLTGWFVYFKELGSVIAPLPFEPRFAGQALDGLGIDPREVFTQPPLFDRIQRPSYVVVPQNLTRSAYNCAHSGSATVAGYGSLSQFARAVEGAVTGDTRSKYIYAYWPKLDAKAHEHGISSRVVARHFVQLDAVFQRLLDALADTDTLLLVTADHGFVDVGPSRTIDVEAHPRFYQALSMPLTGDKRVAYCYVRSRAAAEAVDYARNALGDVAELWPSEALIDEELFGYGEPHPRLSERIGDYALVMRDGYAIGDRVLGERPHTQIGMHSGVSAAEMYVPLVVAAV